jgi:hypothetical protein
VFEADESTPAPVRKLARTVLRTIVPAGDCARVSGGRAKNIPSRTGSKKQILVRKTNAEFSRSRMNGRFRDKFCRMFPLISKNTEGRRARQSVEAPPHARPPVWTA